MCFLGLEFIMITAYIDDLNISITLKKLPKAMDYSRKEFEIKDIRKTKYCLGLYIEHLSNGTSAH